MLRDATDIVANDVGVDFNEADPFAVRVEQGVFDTNAEALMQVGASASANVGEAFATAADGWLTLTPARRNELRQLRLPQDAIRTIEGELDAGHILIARDAPVELKSSTFVGWWRIDPSTGGTLGMSSNGWGQAMAERGVTLHPLIDMASTFAFDYAFCQAVPQVLNQALPFFQAYRDALPWVAWLGPIAPKQDAGKVYQDNRRECLLGAMLTTGITATLPLILTILRSRQTLRMVSACFVAGTLVYTDRGPIPIEEVTAGQFVLSRDAGTGRQAYKRVRNLVVTPNKAVLALTLENARGERSTLDVTADHPLWVVDHGWVPARRVASGELLATSDSDVVRVIKSSPHAAATVYNLEVESFHTYFVGAEGVWVHNNCGSKLPQYLKNKLSRIRNATAAGGMKGVDGAVSARDAFKLGEAFVGPGYRTAEEGRILISSDGLRQFRGPAEKFGIDWVNGGVPFSKTGVQANFQSRLIPQGAWPNNVHLDVIR